MLLIFLFSLILKELNCRDGMRELSVRFGVVLLLSMMEADDILIHYGGIDNLNSTTPRNKKSISSDFLDFTSKVFGSCKNVH